MKEETTCTTNQATTEKRQLMAENVYVLRLTRRGQTTLLMFFEGYICLVYVFLNQVWQMSFLCSPVYFNLEVVTKCHIMTS